MSAPTPGLACYPVDLDAQRAWHNAQMCPPEPHPEPLVAARLAMPHEVARASSVETMRRTARAGGWMANVTYAKGYTLGKPRAACVACLAEANLTSAGKVRKHGPRGGESCVGSGRAPLELPSLTHGPLVESLALRMRYPSLMSKPYRFGAVACYQSDREGGPYGWHTGFFWLTPAMYAKCASGELTALLGWAGRAAGMSDDEGWHWLSVKLGDYREAAKAKAAVSTAKRAATRATKAKAEVEGQLGMEIAA